MSIHDFGDEITIEGGQAREAGPQGPTFGGAQLWAFRLLALVGVCVSSLWVALQLVFVTIGFVAAVLMGMRPDAKRLVVRRWRSVCLGAACLVGCLVTMFSPRFGISIITIYLVIHAEEGGMAGRMRGRFQDAFKRF